MSFISKFRKSERGAAAIEFALAIPLIIIMFYGIAQYGIILLANAGIRHGIDTGARAATVYIGATSMTDTQIRNTVTGSMYGINGVTVTAPAIVRGTSNGVRYVDITVTYSTPIDLIFYRYGPISLSETRRAYLP